jgi:hypothetical protein
VTLARRLTFRGVVLSNWCDKHTTQRPGKLSDMAGFCVLRSCLTSTLRLRNRGRTPLPGES